MGAFENQIRENETFESLMDLYGALIEKTRKLEKRVDALTKAGDNLDAIADYFPLDHCLNTVDTLKECAKLSKAQRSWRKVSEVGPDELG